MLSQVSIGKLEEGNVSDSQRTESAMAMRYPSVTICPKWRSNPKVGMTTNLTADYEMTVPLEQMLLGLWHTYQVGNK
jgi:hypothetical protein